MMGELNLDGNGNEYELEQAKKFVMRSSFRATVAERQDGDDLKHLIPTASWRVKPGSFTVWGGSFHSGRGINENGTNASSRRMAPIPYSR
jgi:hypothetical protein